MNKYLYGLLAALVILLVVIVCAVASTLACLDNGGHLVKGSHYLSAWCVP